MLLHYCILCCFNSAVYANTLLTGVNTVVTVGLQESYYAVTESSDYLEVCVEIISGEIGGESILLHYESIDGSAIGTGSTSSCEYYILSILYLAHSTC